jgi:hypothetical protein
MAAPADHLITTAVAGALARRRGTPVKSNTILVAARRGTIERAVRHGGRWKFPAWAFEEWLMVHIARADYDPNAAD